MVTWKYYRRTLGANIKIILLSVLSPHSSIRNKFVNVDVKMSYINRISSKCKILMSDMRLSQTKVICHDMDINILR